MVAYSFNPRFEQPILSGVKSGTIRAVGRRRHARAGETVQLYVGMRTRQCRLLGEVLCASVDPIELTVLDADLRPHMGWIGVPGDRPHHWRAAFFNAVAIDEFARGDGFEDGVDMAHFWAKTHQPLIREDGVIRFSGVWIRWAPLGGPHDLR